MVLETRKAKVVECGNRGDCDGIGCTDGGDDIGGEDGTLVVDMTVVASVGMAVVKVVAVVVAMGW